MIWQWMQSVIRFLIFSNLHIAFCAALAWNFTRNWFEKSTSVFDSMPLFLATLGAYNFHWFLSSLRLTEGKRIEWTKRNQAWILTFFVLPLSVLVGLLLFQERLNIWWLVIGCMTLLYSLPQIESRPFIHLRKIAVGKPFFLSVVWVLSTVTLPLEGVYNAHGLPLVLFLSNRFLLIYVLCLMFDRRDLHEDVQSGIKGFVYRISTNQFWLLLGVLLLFFFSTAFLMVDNVVSIKAFSLLLPGILLSATAHLSKENQGDYYYYAWLDGLIGVSGFVSSCFT